MEALHWDWKQIDLAPGLDIGDQLQQVGVTLGEQGYADIHVDVGTAYGSKGDTSLFVLYLYIGGAAFWQVITCSACGHGDAATAGKEVAAMAKAIEGYAVG